MTSHDDPASAAVPAGAPTEHSASATAALFAQRFGRPAQGVWSAPGRVNLIGEHTDYNDGFVLPFAIDRRTWVAIAPRGDRMLRVASTFADEPVEISIDDLAPERLSGWSAYPLGVAWALGQHGADLADVPGMDMFFDSSVPVGAGLSSSAAIEASVALALSELWGLGFARPLLARVGRLAENEAVGAPTGIMDQMASLLGEPDSAVFLDCRSFDARAVPLGLEAAGLEVLVIDTRVEHAHATGGYGARRASCELAAKTLGVAALRDVDAAGLEASRHLLDDETYRRARHVVTEDQRVLDAVAVLEGTADVNSAPSDRMHALGLLLDASHVSMRDDFEISVPELDLAVETARAAGAVGARMTGGGFGGSAIALVPTGERAAIAAAVTEAFAGAGFGAPHIFVVSPSQGARREK